MPRNLSSGNLTRGEPGLAFVGVKRYHHGVNEQNVSLYATNPSKLNLYLWMIIAALLNGKKKGI